MGKKKFVKNYEIKTVYTETIVIISHLHTLFKRF